MKGPTNSSARPNIRLLNVSATFESNPDTSNNLEFPYRAAISAEGVTNLMSATVMFNQVQAISGNFATFCQTGTDVVYIYAKTDPGTITIPAVSCDLSVNYINMDNVPTEDSQAVITSGGVYDALALKQNTLTFDTTPTSGSSNPVTSSGIKTALDGRIPVGYTLIKSGTGYNIYQMGKIVIARFEYVGPMSVTSCPASLGYYTAWMQGTNSTNSGIAVIYGDTIVVSRIGSGTDNLLGTLVYIAQ